MVLALVLALASCSRAGGGDPATTGQPRDLGPVGEIRVGYFANVTHAPAIIGVDKGFFARELGPSKLVPQTFNAGPEAISALLGGSLDVAFLGPGPAINAFTKSGGTVRLIAGAVSGGVQLVVKPDIAAPEQLRGRTLATPQLGGTQDIALKTWLARNGLAGQVSVAALKNAQAFDAFRGGEVDGAWLPEPWASRLVLDAHAKVLVDEKTLWPGGHFPTTVVVTRNEFLQRHPTTIRAILRGQVAVLEWAAAHRDEAKAAVNDGIEARTRNRLSPAALDRAFDAVQLSPDPHALTYAQLAQDSVTAGVIPSPPYLEGLIDLRLLNEELAARGKPAIRTAGFRVE